MHVDFGKEWTLEANRSIYNLFASRADQVKRRKNVANRNFFSFKIFNFISNFVSDIKLITVMSTVDFLQPFWRGNVLERY